MHKNIYDFPPGKKKVTWLCEISDPAATQYHEAANFIADSTDLCEKLIQQQLKQNTWRGRQKWFILCTWIMHVKHGDKWAKANLVPPLWLFCCFIGVSSDCRRICCNYSASIRFSSGCRYAHGVYARTKRVQCLQLVPTHFSWHENTKKKDLHVKIRVRAKKKYRLHYLWKYLLINYWTWCFGISCSSIG
jgi:hypothetical protein